MKSILTTLLTVLLIPISVIAAETPSNVTYFIEVCQKAYPQDIKAVYRCIQKAAGLDPDAPPPTPEELYGEPDNPTRVKEVYERWEKEMDAHRSSYLACKGQNFEKCFIEAADQELAIHERLLESLQPPAWPSSVGLRYAKTHAISAILREAISRCGSLASAENATCREKMVDETDRIYFAGWSAYLNKAMEQIERHQAARERKIRSLDQQLRAEESRSQREHELELARIQALGMFLGSGGFRGMQQPLYQPPPPVYQAPPIRPPVNCTTNMIGSQAYTNCN